ncbi:hypothetical protein PVAG01_11265 [Phlyctema vagabunda]|uniref:Ubiquitin-like-conjugating enzyme ATG10 n=1 Tax=Phlyctema vagabunda TaxID=108571 RepID=A0ABR4P1T8_9HELO
MSHRDEYRQWPFLTLDEFELACAFFDQRYMKAELGPSRRTFKLRLRRTATTGTCCIEILRLLSPAEEDGDLTSQLDKLWSSGMNAAPTSNGDTEMSQEEDDEEALRPDVKVDGSDGGYPPQYTTYSHQAYVTYEIHLHPTYSVPVLWFTLHDLPMGEPTFDLNSVFRHLVPDQYKDLLRATGITGGLSAAPHPVTDVPAFFIHPCQTKEAMENFNCPLQDYLMTWVGLTGGCVGLWVPHEMAAVMN